MRFAVHGPINGSTFEDLEIMNGRRSKNRYTVGPTILSRDEYIRQEMGILADENEEFESFKLAYNKFIEELNVEFKKNKGILSFDDKHDSGYYIVDVSLLSESCVAKVLRKYLKERGKKGRIEIVLLDMKGTRPKTIYKNGHARKTQMNGEYITSDGNALFTIEKKAIRNEKGDGYIPTDEELLQYYYEDRKIFNREFEVEQEFRGLVMDGLSFRDEDFWDIREKLNKTNHSVEDMEELILKLKSGEITKVDILEK